MNPSTDSSIPTPQTSDAAAPQRFAGKVALVTGASDRGIGGEIAVRLAREGAAVSLVSRRVPDRLLKKINRFEHGAIHTVVNNAGVELARSLDKFSDEEWRQLIDINLNGAISVTKAALPYLAAPG